MNPSRSLLSLKPRAGCLVCPNAPILPPALTRINATTTRYYALSSSQDSSSEKRAYPTPGPFPTPTISLKPRPAFRDLSAASKVARATRATSDTFIILLGGTLLVGVVYVLYTEIFQPDSKWAWFSRGVDRIKADRRCTDLLGKASSIKAHGDSGGGGFGIRDRGINARTEIDAMGREHIHIVFTVEGERATGKVHLHVVQKRKEDQHDYGYELLCLDVPGHQTVFLEDHRTVLGLDGGKKGAPAKKILGMKWGW